MLSHNIKSISDTFACLPPLEYWVFDGDPIELILPEQICVIVYLLWIEFLRSRILL